MAAKKDVFLRNFPATTTAKVLKRFIEKIMGVAYAIIEFVSSVSVKRILKLGRDIARRASNLSSKPIEDDVHLYVGCKISEDEFLSFWKVEQVTANFCDDKLEFVFYYGDQEYMLKLDISSIMTCMQQNYDNYFLLMLQLRYAPYIFKKDYQKLNGRYDKINYYEDSFEEHWVRTVDFTPLLCIGQATSLCLKVHSKSIREIISKLYTFEISNQSFHVRSGHPYNWESELVPIVKSPSILQDFSIFFKVNSLVQKGTLSWPTLENSAFYDLVDIKKVSFSQVEYGLSSLSRIKGCCFHPSIFLQDKYKAYCTSKSSIPIRACLMNDGLAMVYKIQVTPTKIYFCDLDVGESNRVLRHYQEDISNFAQVSFVDENHKKIRNSDLVSKKQKTDVYRRIRTLLSHGIVVGDKTFEFLAFSTSQLKKQSLWMFARKKGLTAADIRLWMGDFSGIKNVAKYGARMGQSFSASKETSIVDECDIEMIDDITSVSGQTIYTFSDGIGKISRLFAEEIAKKCGIENKVPSAYQIRYAGFKGVVAVDPHSSYKLSLRKSMYKYPSKNNKVDVLNWSKYNGCYLNRQIITLLSTLNIQDSIFENKMKGIIDALEEVLVDSNKAKIALALMGTGGIMKSMLNIGYKPTEEPFLRMMLLEFRNHKLSELMRKARLFVPLGRLLIGCLDETRTLRYGEIFVQVSKAESDADDKPNPFVVKEKTIVCKNPCLHPGDVRILNAVDVPKLYHMVDCVVFPQQGKRPHPDECSGSDLDGDQYFVSWDQELIPPEMVDPMDYDELPARHDNNVNIKALKDYFVEHMLHDKVGIISNAHQVFADQEPENALSPACLELARLFSIAVDSPKTGIPVKIPSRLCVKEYPDFMEKSNQVSYKSISVLGKLYRRVKETSFGADSVNRPITDESDYYDKDMEYDGFMDFVSDACQQKEIYDAKLHNLMSQFGIKTEGEIMSFGIFGFRSEKENSDIIFNSVKSLIGEARHWFEEESDDFHVKAKSSAAYYVTYHRDKCTKLDQPCFITFPWVMHDKLMAIKEIRMRWLFM